MDQVDTTPIETKFDWTEPRPLCVGLVVTNSNLEKTGLGRAFSDTLGIRCDVLRYFNYEDLVRAVIARDVDLAWLAPAAYVRANEAKATELLSTIVREGAESYRSAILGREGVESLQGTSGLRAVWVDQWSASGFLVPRALLRKRGLNPRELFRSERFVGRHDAVLDALKEGKADVGATFCVASQRGRINRRPWRKEYNFNVLALSESIPGDTLCARKDLSEKAVEHIRRALSDPEAIEPILKVFEATQLVSPEHDRYAALDGAWK